MQRITLGIHTSAATNIALGIYLFHSWSSWRQQMRTCHPLGSSHRMGRLSAYTLPYHRNAQRMLLRSASRWRCPHRSHANRWNFSSPSWTSIPSDQHPARTPHRRTRTMFDVRWKPTSCPLLADEPGVVDVRFYLQASTQVFVRSG